MTLGFKPCHIFNRHRNIVAVPNASPPSEHLQFRRQVHHPVEPDLCRIDRLRVPCADALFVRPETYPNSRSQLRGVSGGQRTAQDRAARPPDRHRGFQTGADSELLTRSVLSTDHKKTKTKQQNGCIETRRSVYATKILGPLISGRKQVQNIAKIPVSLYSLASQI